MLSWIDALTDNIYTLILNDIGYILDLGLLYNINLDEVINHHYYTYKQDNLTLYLPDPSTKSL